ncbi:MAG: Cytidylate kinaselike family [Candidatus Eremiobacteraeota bacterium]|nr:Cytidylate kinaselike family [Candidatus Eremiobacteraeota bacterium]
MIVTVSRAYGAAAHDVAAAAAERLGYRFADRELPVVVAARLGTSSEAVESVAERPPSFGERVMQQLGGGVPETAQLGSQTEDDFSIDTRRAIEGAVREIAAAGNVIVSGRMAGTILGPRPDVLRVFIYAPMAWRIAHVCESLGCDVALARDEILRIDEARRAYAKIHYRVTWGDPRNYDLMLDTSRFGIDGSADLIVAAVRAVEA